MNESSTYEIDSQVDSYAVTAAIQRARALHARNVFRMASQLHDKMSREGGFTWRYNSETPTTGFVVSDGRRELKLRTVTVESLYRYLLAHWGHVMAMDNRWFGCWVDGDFTYLDISSVYGWRDQAMRVARERHELAVYSLHDAVSIPVEQEEN